MVARFPVDEVPEGKPKTTSRARVPEAWERYLIGELATMPEGFTGVREQLELYGVLPEQKRAPARGRQPSRRPEVARPVPAAPGLDWQALRQWLALYCAHLLGLNRAPRTLEAYRWELERFFAACEAKGLTPRGLRRLDLLLYLAELAQPPPFCHRPLASPGAPRATCPQRARVSTAAAAGPPGELAYLRHRGGPAADRAAGLGAVWTVRG
jgi:hypothetical protein